MSASLVVAQARNFDAVQPIRAARRLVQAADHVHKRRLAGPGRPHDGDKLAALNAEADMPQGMDFLRAHHVGLGHVLHLY